MTMGFVLIKKKGGEGRLYSGVQSFYVGLVLPLYLIFTCYLQDEQVAFLLYFITVMTSLHRQVGWGLCFLFGGGFFGWLVFWFGFFCLVGIFSPKKAYTSFLISLSIVQNLSFHYFKAFYRKNIHTLSKSPAQFPVSKSGYI